MEYDWTKMNLPTLGQSETLARQQKPSARPVRMTLNLNYELVTLRSTTVWFIAIFVCLLDLCILWTCIYMDIVHVLIYCLIHMCSNRTYI